MQQDKACSSNKHPAALSEEQQSMQHYEACSRLKQAATWSIEYDKA
jgi:hypothetical protein